LGNQIELLINLQVIDRQLRERTEAISALQGRIQEIETRLAGERSTLETCKAERNVLDKRRREIEGLLSDEESKMKDRRMRLNRIRNEKEASAIRREIEVAKEETAKVEEELMGDAGIYNALKILNDRQTELQTAFDALEAERAAEQTRVDAEVERLSSGLDDARAQREVVARDLEAGLRKRYEGIFERRRGLAVVVVRAGSCEGCHMSVAPQLVNEIKRNERVITCPSCHRILYFAPEPVAADV
jgi:predicted  nucleic acid-binding Zn-ribbon protein